MDKKYFILIGMVLLMVGVANAMARIQPSISDAISERVDGEPVTTILDDNTAYVQASTLSFAVDTFNATKDDTVTISLSKSENIQDICFSFPVSTDYITVHNIKGSQFLWFDKDLDEYLTKTQNQLCYNNIDLSGDAISYQIEYLGRDTIEYNITIDDVTLDPYLIGSLNQSGQLLFSIPFKGNINATFASVPIPLNSSSTRQNTTPATASNDGYETNPTNAYDQNWATLATTSDNSQGYIYLTYSKTATDTGMVLEYKGYAYNNGFPVTAYSNLSTPVGCFNAASTQVSYAIFFSENRADNPNYWYHSYVQFYCYDGNIYQDMSGKVFESYSTTSYAATYSGIYDTVAFITNQSNYVAYNNTVPVTHTYNSSNTLQNPEYIGAPNIVGESNSAMNLTGNIYVNISQISNVSQFTISAWFKPAMTLTNSIILAKGLWGGAVNGDYSMSVQNGLLNGYVETGSGSQNVVGHTPIDITRWHHGLMTFNGSAIGVYLDGSQEALTTISGTLGNNTRNLKIGSLVGGGYFNGSISDVLFYNYVLSPAEIATLSNGWNNSISVTAYDGQTGNILSGTANLALYGFNTNYSATQTSSNGLFFINGVPPDTYRITVSMNGYSPATSYNSIVTANTAYSYNLYLMNTSSTGTKAVTLYVRDEADQGIENADILILAQNGSSFYTFNDVRTNINGQRQVDLIQDTVYYKFVITYNNQVCYTTINPFPIQSIDDNIYFRCISSGSYTIRKDIYNNVNYSIVPVNTSNTTGYFTILVSAANTGQICSYVFQNPSQENTLVNQTCVNGTLYSNTINVDSTALNATTVYSAQVYYTPVNETVPAVSLTETLRFEVESHIDWGNLGYFIVILAMVLVVSFMFKYPSLMVAAIGVIWFIGCYVKLIYFGQYNTIVAVTGLAICCVVAVAIETRYR